MSEEGYEPEKGRCDGDRREEEDDEAYIAGRGSVSRLRGQSCRAMAVA